MHAVRRGCPKRADPQIRENRCFRLGLVGGTSDKLKEAPSSGKRKPKLQRDTEVVGLPCLVSSLFKGHRSHA